MDIAVLTFDGFNELDSFIASGILNRMKEFGWNVQITSPTESVTSMNGVTIKSQQPLEFANTADAVLFGSGLLTRDIAQDDKLLSRLNLNRQFRRKTFWPTENRCCCSGCLWCSCVTVRRAKVRD